ncbi:MAG TPA: MlaD family protein [Sphingobacteriaceae bacterium]|nr:MlaD family protein [Sphingobacteriaceae bacterium]
MKINNETKVGVLAAVAIAILILGYNFLKGNDVFSSENDFYSIYDNVDGLAASNAVLVNGFKIGRVSKLSLQPNGKILAQFKIKPDYEIPKSTIAKLESTSLLGGKAIVFELGTSKVYAEDGDTLRSGTEKNLMEQVEPVQKKAEKIIARMDSLLTSLNNTVSPEFQRNFQQSFASIARSMQTLEGTTRKFDNLVGTQSNKIASILNNFESISVNLKNNNKKISSIMSNIDKVTDEVARANFALTIQNANKAMTDLQATVNKINTGQGSLGMLINDEKMYTNLNSAAANLDKLMIDLKANPKRYVHFSVFGGKKKE